MISVTLNAQERQQLTAVMKTASAARLRVRCQAILMASRGRQHSRMAEDLGISVRTGQRWLKAYGAGGLAGLKIRWAAGRVAKIPERLAPEVLAWGKHGPASWGLDRANWTYAELAA
jgi:transposase